MAKRDYSLIGPDAQRAVETGLASAEWYHTDVPRKEMKALMHRNDGPAIRDTIIWLGAMIVLAGAAVWLWPSAWSVPFFLAYGVLYGSAGDSRWHECGHGTAFKTRWMNDAVYQLASFTMMREPAVWRWSHTRHHTDTIIVGRDPEIVAMRPPDLVSIVLNVFAIRNTAHAVRHMLIHAAGRLTEEEKTFVPEMEWARVIWTARIWLTIHLSIVALAVAVGSWLPVLLVGPLPTMYGAWFSHMVGLTQHAGLAENVLDHRLNSRTVMMNPVFRFLYWNMNYHVEHHMFPMVPYHRLPELHEKLRADMPEPYPSTFAAYREIVPTLIRQRREPEFFIRRELPATARPYRPDLHGEIVQAAAQ
jgi:fatty acid desaturase